MLNTIPNSLTFFSHKYHHIISNNASKHSIDVFSISNSNQHYLSKDNTSKKAIEFSNRKKNRLNVTHQHNYKFELKTKIRKTIYVPEWCLFSQPAVDERCVVYSITRRHYKLVHRNGFFATATFVRYGNSNTIIRHASMHSTHTEHTRKRKREKKNIQ